MKPRRASAREAPNIPCQVSDLPANPSNLLTLAGELSPLRCGIPTGFRAYPFRGGLPCSDANLEPVFPIRQMLKRETPRRLRRSVPPVQSYGATR